MTDIVERLRTNPAGGEETDETSLEAAVEIERLRAALEKIRDTDHSTALAYRIIAKEALGDAM